MIIAALLAAASVATPPAFDAPFPSPARPAAVALVWHLTPAPYADESVRAAYVALIGADSLMPQLRALRAHPNAHFSLAVDADALNSLARAATGDTPLHAMASGHFAGDPRAGDLMRLLSQVPTLNAHLAATRAARRLQALAAAAPLALAGQRAAKFTSADYVDFAGFGAIIRLAAAGALPANAPLLAKSELSSAEAGTALSQLAKFDASVLDDIKSESAAGQLEVLATPAREPILPLLIDGGGKSGPNIVLVDAAADAAASLDAAMRGVTALAPSATQGFYSPHGAYDDKLAALLLAHHAAFALFSDRVLRASPIGGSREAVAAADTAAFHAYALHAATGAPLPTLFWSQDSGAALSVLSPRLPASAMGARVGALARNAGANGGEVLVLRVEADGLWNRRPDRTTMIDALAAALASDSTPSVLIAQYVRIHPPTLSSYGFSPASDEGALTYWMGTANQASMWNALAAARKAAGGDAALEHEATRAPLLEAEASHWYLAPTMLAPASEIERLLGEFRSLLGAVYRGASKPVPANIAPVKLEVPSPAPSPRL